MRKGQQQPLPTPGTNRKVWISGALNRPTGHFHRVVGSRKSSELFPALLGELRRIYRCYRRIQPAIGNDGSHLSCASII